MLKIWGRLNSINVMKVMWCVEELGVEHQRVDAGMQHGVVGDDFYAKPSSEIVALVATISVLGFALFAVRPVIHSWMMDLVPASLSGSATSLLFGTQALLSATVPPIGGLIADAYGLSAVFYLLAGTMLVANFLVFLLPHQEGRREG